MKTAIRKSLVLVVLFLATSVSYGNEISGNTNDGKGVTTNLTFNYVTKGSILLIKDYNGMTLYKELIEKNGTYTKGFDLTSLPDGNYYFELSKDVEISVIPFKIEKTVVTFDKTKEVIYFKPVVWLNKSKVYISKMTLEDEFLEIEILSSTDESILHDKVERKGNMLGKIYDFSTSEKGTYTIIIKSNGRRFVNHVTI